MINIFLLAYILIVIIFLGGVTVVMYHLNFYHFEKSKTNTMLTVFFIGSLFFLLISVGIAFTVDWAKWNLIF